MGKKDNCLKELVMVFGVRQERSTCQGQTTDWKAMIACVS